MKNFAVKNISFTLPRGYIMGCRTGWSREKITTIKMIMNLIRERYWRYKNFLARTIRSRKGNKTKYRLCIYDENQLLRRFNDIEQMESVLFTVI